MSNSYDPVWHAELCLDRAQIPSDCALKGCDSVQILPENDLFSLTSDRIFDRGAGYGAEDAFGDIADRLNLWLRQRFGPDARISDISLTEADAADILSEFKQARRLVRLRSGVKDADDTVDQAGYIWWRFKKERNHVSDRHV